MAYAPSEEPAPPLSVLSVRELPVYSWSTGWQAPAVAQALADFEVGALHNPHAMWIAMLRDPVVAHGLKLRVDGLLQTPFSWERPEDLDPALHAEWCARWPDVCRADDLASIQRQRIGVGLVPTFCQWTIDHGGTWWPRRLDPKDVGNVTYFPTEDVYRIITLSDGQLTILDDADPWLLFREPAARRSYLYGAARALAGVWFAKSEAAELRAGFARAAGNPLRDVQMPLENRAPTEGAPDSKRYLERAQRLMGLGVFQTLVDKEGKPLWTIRYVEPKGDAREVFDQIINPADDYITLFLTGALDNSRGGGSGSEARAKIHERQTTKYTGADCMAIADRFAYVARRWCSYNGLPVSAAPRPVFRWQPEEDRAQAAAAARDRAAAVKALSEAAGGMDRLQAAGLDLRALLCSMGLPMTGAALAQPGQDGR